MVGTLRVLMEWMDGGGWLSYRVKVFGLIGGRGGVAEVISV